MVSLGTLPGYTDSLASAVSADGSVIIGWTDPGFQDHEAFRWTATGGMVSLGKLTRQKETEARALSGDGSVIVGNCYASWAFRAFIWDKENGIRELQSVLTNDYKLNLTGWKLQEANGISADGRTIVGTGEHRHNLEAWVAHLDRPLNAPAAKGKSQEVPSSR